MKYFTLTALALALFLLAGPQPVAFSRDMRAAGIRAQEVRANLLQKMEAEKKQAVAEAKATRSRILADRKRLAAATIKLQAEVRSLEAEVAAGETELAAMETAGEKLTADLAERRAVTNELVGHIRVMAKDLDALVVAGFGQALQPGRHTTLAAIAARGQFPGMEDLHHMVTVLEEEIAGSGEVRLVRGPLVDRNGKTTAADLLLLGHFTAAYRNVAGSGYLNYRPGSRKFFTLQRPSPGGIRRGLQAYLDGQSDAVALDITRGGALQQLSHRTDLMAHIARGGPIVWPILGVLVLGLAIILERAIYLYRKRIDADSLMNQLSDLAAFEEWDACRALCNRFPGKPVSRVLQAGLDCRRMERPEMENVLQEAILQEIPGLERFLSTLGMLAAIAPLLGLLGTVTGMINTFDMITHYGTGNPRMMSGGISEALITTMLGLSVAIPILLCHTLLSRQTENMIAQMEEKAVAFTNILFKTRGGRQ